MRGRASGHAGSMDCDMTRLKTPPTKPAEVEEPKLDIKMRRCLMCTRNFESEWAGERICRKCKSTSTWKSGA